MIPVLLSFILSCEDANWIVAGALKSQGLTAQHRIEIIETVMDSTDGTCEMDLPDRDKPFGSQ
jgi:hypothetical protein